MPEPQGGSSQVGAEAPLPEGGPAGPEVHPVEVEWPDSLLRQIVAGRWILFVGAGVAATSTNAAGASPLGWAALLRRLALGIADVGRQARAIELIGAREYLSATEHIQWCYRSAGRLNDFFVTIKESVKGPEQDLFQPGDAYSMLLDLSPTTVVTTNYDRLFETASKSAYDSLVYSDPTIGSSIRQGNPVLLKLHGRVDEMPSIVITRSDYLHLKRQGGHALEVLRSLFQTNTTLFVGYSVQDPDVQLMLEAGAGYCDPESHYLLTRSNHEPWELDTFQKFYGVSTIRYDESLPLEHVLADLRDQVNGRWVGRSGAST